MLQKHDSSILQELLEHAVGSGGLSCTLVIFEALLSSPIKGLTATGGLFGFMAGYSVPVMIRVLCGYAQGV